MTYLVYLCDSFNSFLHSVDLCCKTDKEYTLIKPLMDK